MKHRQTLLILAVLAMLVAATPTLAEGPSPEPPGNPTVNFRGVIEEKTTPQQWKISGVVVQLNAQTVVLEQAGPADVGATVQVVGVRQQDRSILARVIQVLKPPAQLRPVQFTAPIVALPSGGLLGEWTVGAEIVVVSDGTTLLPEGVVPAEGDIAHVTGLRMSDGKVDAKIIQIRRPSQVEVSFTGPIQSFSDTEWMVRYVKVLIAATTVIEGEPQVGLIAEVKGFLQLDRSVIATHILVREPQVEPVTFQGIIVSKSADGIPSVWGIRPLTTIDLFPSIINVAVTADTAIDESKGPADVGALVQVGALPADVSAGSADDAVLTAKRIKVLRPPINQEIIFAGRIEQIHEDYWIVRGVRVLISSATVIEGLPPAVGLMAVVVGLLRTDRIVEASHIEVKEALPDIIEFNGVIREKTVTLPGEWKIAPDGPLTVIYNVWVTSWTQIVGPADVDAHVHVVALRSVSGHLVALKIEVLADTLP
jgi:hypothetical protein